jgi:hypothetical protein
VLADIQSEKGVYYQSRQNINRDIRNNQALIEEIARDIPEGYDAEKWEKYNLGEKYRELEKLRENNANIERAKSFADAYDNKIRGMKADRDIAISAEEKLIANERENLSSNIARMKAEIKAAENNLAGLDGKLKDKIAVIEAQYQEKIAKLDADEKIANEWSNKKPVDISELAAEVDTAEAMKNHLNEYRRMKSKQSETDRLIEQADALTTKIEKAREMPGEILKSAKIPIDGLTVEDGVPLINGLPISNLSGGELLELCVEIAAAKPGQLNILLIDEVGRLDTRSRSNLYRKCIEKGISFIATRATDSDDIEVMQLESISAVNAYEKSELMKGAKSNVK